VELPAIGGLEAAIGATGILVLGYAATAWNKSRQFLIKMFSFIVVPQQINDHELSMAIQKYLGSRGRRRKLGIRSFTAFLAFLKSKGDWQHVAFENLNKHSNIFWVNFRPVWFEPSKEEPKEGQRISHPTMVRFVRWSFPYYHFINQGLRILNKQREERKKREEAESTDFFVEYVIGNLRKGENASAEGESPSLARSGSGGADMSLRSNLALGFDWDDIGENQGSDAFKSLILGSDQKRILQEIQFWLDHREWYQERSIPWRRGYVFHGKPGTGKSSFVRAVGQNFDLPIYIFDLASMDNQYLSKAWSLRCQLYRRRIILIEDIDGVFEGRKNIAAPNDVQGVTFDCLLNLIDGVDRTDGTLLFITTNRLDVLDPALGGGSTDEVGSRPGRVDRVVELGNLGYEGRLTMAERIIGDLGHSDEIKELAQRHQEITPASFQEICIQVALNRKWDLEAQEARNWR